MASQENTSSFSYRTLEELVQACTNFYHANLEKATNKGRVRQRRQQLARWVEKFHRDCGTLSPRVEESIDDLCGDSCLVLMTAHQPNLFAYGGVLRKATLNRVLAKKLSEKLGLPVVGFFGLADQDFTDDRWVRSALLPEVERRGGVLELRVDLPEKMILNRIAKPSETTLDGWQNEIAGWLDRNLSLVNRCSNRWKAKLRAEKALLVKNFQEFWSVVEKAYSNATTYSDFNGFVISRIVNDAWNYDTLFARFSECQQVFDREFTMLLSRFDEYSRYLKEATESFGDSRHGVYEQEYETFPFWFHCGCGSKARLIAEQQGENLAGSGPCLRCGKEHRVDFSSKYKPDISAIMSKISARSVAVPLVFFEGLGVLCYVGGVGGKDYLEQARYVAEHMGLSFPPVMVWRPKDVYLGLGQIGSLLTYRSLSGNCELSGFSYFRKALEQKLENVQREIETLENQKKLESLDEGEKEEIIKRNRKLWAKQDQIRRESCFTLLSRNLKLLDNIESIMNLHPCVIDYAVNVGLEKISEQWTTFLRQSEDLSANVYLETSLENVVACEKY